MKSYMRLDQETGATIRDLAKKYGCSIGLVHKILSDGKEIRTMDKVLDFEMFSRNKIQ